MDMEIRFEQLFKVWPDGTKALSQVDVTVRPGEFCVLLGHSGAGKSTLLRCVNGLEMPTHGCVRIGGRIVDRHSLP